MLEEDKILKRIERHKETREDITPILEKNIIAADALKHFDYER